MTGRRGRMISLLDGSVQYQLRSEADVSLELLNIAEKQRFMDGEKVHHNQRCGYHCGLTQKTYSAIQSFIA